VAALDAWRRAASDAVLLALVEHCWAERERHVSNCLVALTESLRGGSDGGERADDHLELAVRRLRERDAAMRTALRNEPRGSAGKDGAAGPWWCLREVEEALQSAFKQPLSGGTSC
jgi:hypothetical protein